MLVSKKENWYRVLTRNTTIDTESKLENWTRVGGKKISRKKWFDWCLESMQSINVIHLAEPLSKIVQFSSVISWMSVLLVEGTRGPGKNHQPAVSHWQTLSHNVVNLALIALISSVVIGTDCIGSCKCNYHTINATTAPPSNC